MRKASALLLLAALAGCGRSPKTRTLTLDAVAPAPAAMRADYRGAPIAVPAVHVPAALDRAQFAREAAAGEVQVDDFARWAAPLGLLARDALVRDLTARLPEGTVLPPGAAAAPGARVLDVTILALDLRAGGASLQASYRVLPAGPVRQAILTTGAPAADPPAAARAFAGLLGQLADRIAADLPPGR